MKAPHQFRRYDVFSGYWPQQGADNLLNIARKYVVTSKAVSTDWKETIPIHCDVAAEIGRLKQPGGPMLQVHGSGELIQTLLKMTWWMKCG